MSRLKFKEKYFSDESIGDESTDSEHERRMDKTLLKSGTSQANPIVLDEDESVIAEDEVQVTPKKKNKKNKKKKKKNKQSNGPSDNDTASNAISTPQDLLDVADDVEESGMDREPPTVVPTSSWLGAFLQKKRTVDIMPPPDIEVSYDTFLRSFNQEFDNDKKDDDSDDDFPLGVTAEDPFASTDKVDDLGTEEEASSGTKLNFYNLPYSITEAELLQFGSKLGYTFTNIKIGFDKKKNLPSGSASAEIVGADVDMNACVSALQSENCCGRPVRVQRSVPGGGGARRRLSGVKDSSRYFVNDITVKCQNCGEVGHKQFECSNDAIPTPCHLCAGKDHEAMNCPNITCFRCGQFGHHSRDCKNDRNSRPLFCSQCGSCTHDVKQCRADLDSGGGRGRLDSRVEGRWIKCISCNQFGHTMCQSLPKLSHFKGVHADVYCPNCGEKGHHIDYPSFDNAGSGCKAPKYEAFVKFPRLLQDTDGKSGAEKNEYYRDLLRTANFSDRQLFPSLNTNYSNSSYNSSGGGGGGGGNSYQPVRNGIVFNDGPSFHDRQSGRFSGNNNNHSSGGGGRHEDLRDDYHRHSHSGGALKRKHGDYADDEEEEEDEYDRRPVKRHSRFGPAVGSSSGGGGGGGGHDNTYISNNNHRRQSSGGGGNSNSYSHNDSYEGRQSSSYHQAGREGRGGGGQHQNPPVRQRHSYSGGEQIRNVRDTVKEEFETKAAARKSRFG